MWGFLLASLLVELTPGPNMTWLAVVGATHGRKAALAAVGGIALGLSMAGIISALGLVVLFDLFPSFLIGLRWAGTLYLFYLAYEAWIAASEPEAHVGLTSAHFFRGFLSNALNPKAYLFYAAILPQFLSNSNNQAREVAVLTSAYVFVASAVHIGIALLSGSFANWLRQAREAIIFHRLMALAIGLTAVWFFISTEQMR